MTEPDAPLLIPSPPRIERRAGFVTLPPGTGPDAVRGLLHIPLGDGRSHGPRLPPWLSVRITGAACGMKPVTLQGYTLRASSDSNTVTIESPTTAGARHGLATLTQLLRQYGARTPSLAITDSPAFATRGVMLDVSRDRVPTMTELFRIIDHLVELKFNHLQLYTEHTFAYAGHEEIWRGWSPITPAEAIELDSYCKARGVALAANQNCFGHLAAWLRHPTYAHLAETHGDWKFYHWTRSGPFSLCPGDPGSLRLVEDWLGQLLPCFSSGLCNINADETFDVGWGRSKDDVARRGRAAVYFDFIHKICEAVRRHGHRPMFWADIALSLEKESETHYGAASVDEAGRRKLAESLAMIPEDMIGLAWGYEPEAPFGHWCDLLRGAGREAWVCPGTSAWRSTTGRTSERRANLHRAAREGLKHGATGFLVTDWGDVGHTQQWPISMHGIAEAAQAAWNGSVALEAPTSPGSLALTAFHAAESLHCFEDASLKLGGWLDELGDVDVSIRANWATKPDGQPGRLHNATALFTDFRLPWCDPLKPGTAEAWAAVAAALASLRDRITPSLPPLLRDELIHAVDVAEVSVARAISRRRSGTPTASDRSAFTESMNRIMANHARLWSRRSRPGGLDNSQKHYQKILDDLDAQR